VAFRAWIRFIGGLEDHLAAGLRGRQLEKTFHAPGSVKDFFESFGVPHTEVGSVLVNGVPVDFGRLVLGDDVVEVRPVAGCMSLGAGFVLDVHLGRLAAFLRMLGFDATYRSCFEDAELARISARESRALLTRDRGLLMRNEVVLGYWLRNTDSRLQVEEVVRRFDLAALVRPWTRCMACNALLRSVSKAAVIGRIPPRTAECREEFSECSGCTRVYWKGSHYDRMQRWVEEMVG
jgi:uncharacterized protein with PIN domain